MGYEPKIQARNKTFEFEIWIQLKNKYMQHDIALTSRNMFFAYIAFSFTGIFSHYGLLAAGLSMAVWD